MICTNLVKTKKTTQFPTPDSDTKHFQHTVDNLLCVVCYKVSWEPTTSSTSSIMQKQYGLPEIFLLELIMPKKMHCYSFSVYSVEYSIELPDANEERTLASYLHLAALVIDGFLVFVLSLTLNHQRVHRSSSKFQTNLYFDEIFADLVIGGEKLLHLQPEIEKRIRFLVGNMRQK